MIKEKANYKYTGIGLYPGKNGWYSLKLSEYTLNYIEKLKEYKDKQLVLIPCSSITSPKLLEECTKKGLGAMLFAVDNKQEVSERQVQQAINEMTHKIGGLKCV